MDLDNVRYKNEPGHNYLILTGEDNEKFTGYRCKMIEKNSIECFNEVHIEYVDNIPEYYYDISSMQSLVDMFDGRKINYDDVRSIVTGIKKLCEVCGEYLLKMDEILLEPEYIYVNPQTMTPKFCYFPGNPHTVKEGIISISRFFLEVVEHNDKNSVEYVYNLYCECVKDDFLINKWVDTELNSGSDKFMIDRKQPAAAVNENMLSQEDVIVTSRKFDMINDNISGKKIFAVIIVCIIIMAAVYFSDSSYFIACGIVMAIFAGGYMFLCSRDGVEDNHDNNYDDYEEHYTYESKEDEVVEDEGDSDEEDMETVLMSVDLKEVNYLICKNTGMRFDIMTFPYSIGTMKQRNDLYPESDKVSRVHARIVREKNEILLEDMNSKNGSFVNGSRLEPYEKRKIKYGDVIRIADVEYIFKSN